MLSHVIWGNYASLAQLETETGRARRCLIVGITILVTTCVYNGCMALCFENRNVFRKFSTMHQAFIVTQYSILHHTCTLLVEEPALPPPYNYTVLMI